MTTANLVLSEEQPRNLIVCSDGTGNAGGKTRGTNIWRIYNAIERRGDGDPVQIAFYDDGVGTEDFKLWKILGGAFGLGFTRNLVDAYSFLSLNYDPRRGDRIYLFGFSRGAFTVRTLAGIIVKCGLLSREHFLGASEPRKLVRRIIKAYRRIGALAPPSEDAESHAAEEKAGADLAQLREEHPELTAPVQIHFVGVFDTVDAVGIPSDWLRAPLDWLSRKLLGWRLYDFRDRELSPQVGFGAHALSIDDERKTFHPNIWDETRGDSIQQVWFAGAHSNVGGGYPRDAVSLVPLEWMIEHAEAHGLRFVPDALARLRAADGQTDWIKTPIRTERNALARGLATADAHGQLYNPRKGVGVIYTYAPRELPAHGVRIHASVYDRIVRGTGRYAPRVLPADAEVAVSKAGPWAQAPICVPRWTTADLERVDRLAGMRTATYRVFVALLAVVVVTLGGVMAGAFGPDAVAPATGWLWGLVRWPMPGFAAPVVDLAAMYPWVSAATAATFGLLLATSSTLRSAIAKTSFSAWQHAIAELDLDAEPSRPEADHASFAAQADAHLAVTRWRVRGLRVATAVAAVAGVALALGSGRGGVTTETGGAPPVSAGPPEQLAIPLTAGSSRALERFAKGVPGLFELVLVESDGEYMDEDVVVMRRAGRPGERLVDDAIDIDD